MNQSQLDRWKICRETSSCFHLQPPPRPPPFPHWFFTDQSSNRTQSIFIIISIVLLTFLFILLGFLFYDKLRQRLFSSKTHSCPSTSESQTTNQTIYEEIPSISSDFHHHYCLCPTVNPYYQIYETTPSYLACENCLFARAALNRHSNLFSYQSNINNILFK